MRSLSRTVALLVACAGLLPAAPAGAAGPVPRIGIFAPEGDPEIEAARKGLLDALRLGGLDAAVSEAVCGPDETEARDALAAIVRPSEGVEVVVALGDAAAVLARAAVRDRYVVFAVEGDPIALGLRGSGTTCGATGWPGAESIVADLRKAVTGLERLGVVVPAGDEAAAAAAREIGAETDVVAATPEGGTPEIRAADTAAKLFSVADAVWLPPSLPREEVAALARAAEGRRVPLVGSRRAHLDAGCAMALRADPWDLGALAAVLVKRVLDRADAARLPVRTPARRLVEVNLLASRRQGFDPPLPLLVRADHVVLPPGVRR